MLRQGRHLKNFALRGLDGDLGRVRDFYFDEPLWDLRYLVVETGEWLGNRQVLVAPEALGMPRWEEAVFPVHLTRGQVRESPATDAVGLLSRPDESRLRTHYGWPIYWATASGPVASRSAVSRIGNEDVIESALHSAGAVIGCNLRALDGDIGHVTDLLIDDEAWAIRYLVVDTRNWLPGRHVLFPPRWISRVDWVTGRMEIDLSRSAVGSSPTFESACPITPDYSARLDHYYRPYLPAAKRPRRKPALH